MMFDLILDGINGFANCETLTLKTPPIFLVQRSQGDETKERARKRGMGFLL
jgi:hypothetical protein